MTENRLQKLEETITHQDQQIADLSEMLILQGREITRLERDLKRLHAKIETYEADMQDGEEDGKQLSPADFAARNKPPHW